MGYGNGPFGTIPAGGTAPLPLATTPPKLASSRKIDGTTGRYVTTADGDFEPMNDTDQRLLLLICFADINPKIITPAALRDQEQRVRDALAPLLDPRAPAIKLLSVVATNPAPGVTLKSVRYQNLHTNETRTVER